MQSACSSNLLMLAVGRKDELKQCLMTASSEGNKTIRSNFLMILVFHSWSREVVIVLEKCGHITVPVLCHNVRTVINASFFRFLTTLGKN